MNIKNFIWDFDGTLYNTYPIMVEAFKKTMTDFTLQMDAKEIYRIMKQQSVRALRESFAVDQELFNQRFHQYEAERLDKSKPFPETQTVLQKLQQQGGQHFILSHRSAASANALLTRDNLLDLITEIVGADSGFPRKPVPDSLLYLLNKYQLLPDATLMIGDRKLDVEAGKNAGVKTCLYDIDGFLGKIDADFTVNQLTDILKITQN